jgi:FtsP/CotA-like multicopper oxidase with cupredoxin domain
MRSTFLKTTLRTALLTGASVLLIAGVSPAVAAANDVYLQAQSFDKALPANGGTVPMWGFALCDATFINCDLPSETDAPGPQIHVSTADTLTIHLKNTLDTPVSIAIPGQAGGGDPEWSMDGQGRRRVQSLTHETAPGLTADYTWSSLRPGTYLYQSGTHPSIQVPMGLYGALIVHPSTPSYASTVLADGPIHYYRLGESTTADAAVDLGTGLTDGTYGSTVKKGLLGYGTDSAARFDGTTATDFVDTGVTSMSASAFSVEAWVNAAATDGQHRIVAKDEIGVTGAWILWFNQDKLRFQVRNSTDTAWVIAEAPTTPPAGTTFQVVGVFDGTDAILYVDGIEVASIALGTPTTNTNALPITIGADSDTVGARGHIFDGTIDEVAIYESALTATQIQAHFDANNAEPVALFSEIDPSQNVAVYAATGDVTSYPSTVDYNPTYFLINGESHDTASPPPAIPAGMPGKDVLVRFLNAGLRSHTPAIVGLDMRLVAEDGNPYPGLLKRQASSLLPAGKTLDVLVAMPAVDATYPLFDRMLDLSNDNQADGGMLAYLQVGTGSPPPTAPPEPVLTSYDAIEDTALIGAAPGGISGATLVSGPSNGMLVLNGDGSFTYTPYENFSGSDGFTYRAGDGTLVEVALNVSFENDVPVAADDGPYVNAIGPNITVAAPGVLGNDMDPDGDTLRAVIEGTAPAGLTLHSDGSFEYTGGTAVTFTYRASDGTGLSDPATVTLNINPVANITLIVKDPLDAAVADYRWVVEEDAMWQPNPSVVPPPIDTLATNFHKSYMPIVAQGSGAAEFAQLALDPTKHYYVSVLPADAASGTGHTIGGARIPPAATAVTVNVNNQPLPSAQISVYVFEDSSPTNGAVDGGEAGLGLGGFQITLEDAGGRYGISGGTMMQDAFGNPLQNSLDCFGGAPPPMGVILTCPNTVANQEAGLVGQALIKNLYPGKYGIIAAAPPGPETWTQTSTIEGTKVIDAWVKAGEPPFFQEFGPAGWHVFVGFVNPDNLVNPGGANTVTGSVTNLHMSRPPDQTLWDSESYDALAHTRAWVGLNSAGGLGPNIAAVQADADGSFTIGNVPDGSYQLVVWDSYLDQVIAYRGVELPGGGAVGNVPVFQWFARTEHNVFLDENLNGIRDPDEGPVAEQAVNLRWRDGTVNQSFPTDGEGFVPFDQTFPFFHWQVLEVDFTRFKATGLTVTVDGGGDVSATGNVLNPQLQADGVSTTRTELGPVLTEGFQGFLGQTSVFDWGKAPYAPGENGGISGIVYYPSTRAENDPRLAVGEPWEPGIPGVKVRLYREVETSAYANTILADEPNHYYRLGESTTAGPAIDQSGASDGTYGSTVTLPATGLLGNSPNTAAGFDGTTATDFVDTGVTALPEPGGPFSVEAWVNATTIDTAGHRIVVKDEVGVTGAWLLWLNQGKLRFQVRNSTDTAWVIAEAPTTPPAGTPFHVVGVFDGTDAILYVDGVEVDRIALGTATTNVNGLPITIGADSDAVGVRDHIFDGTIDEVALYGAALTAEQIQAHFDANGALTTALALVEETTTDSWDDSLPTGCPGAHPSDAILTGGPEDKCYDGLRNFNQARPAVFDGGYAFMDIPPGKYVVEVVPPPGYDLLKEEDNNVGFGDAFGMAPVAMMMPGGAMVMIMPNLATVLAAMGPEPGLAQPPCVGEVREVPPYLSLFPDEMIEAPFAGDSRPLCDRKEVILSDQGQAAADFFLFTGAPIAGHFAGMVLDDLAQEFSIFSPQFGEKWAPPFVPVSIRDYQGAEISRIYSDQWGRINGLVPSTFTANMPSPSGYSPAMLITCMNDPGPIPDPANPGQSIVDPQYNPAYSNFCYTFQYMPGTTTYLDTPVLPVSAFASGYNPPDCALPAGTPSIRQVDGTGAGPLVAPGGTLTIHSLGSSVEVPNPAYEGPLASGAAAPKTIQRDFGFGAQGPGSSVTVGGVPLAITSWDADTIEVTAPATEMSGELVVTRDNGNSTVHAATVTVSNETPIRVAAGGSIQDAIDNAPRGALILVEPGAYDELVIMWKPVRLQGAGAGSTFLNAAKRPTETMVAWREKMDCVFGIGAGCTDEVDALPTQPDGAAGVETEEGAAITVLGVFDSGEGPPPAGAFRSFESRIDGFSITGGDIGGGIFVNGYAHGLEIANNRVFGNAGSYHGGVRVGRPFLELTGEGPFAFNPHVKIHDNAIIQNGGLGGAGGGLSLCTGSDFYVVSHNFVCGNFTTGDGGGIGHLGLSNNGVIEDNRIVLNQSFAQATTRSGGGLFIAGEPPVVDGLTRGSGSVLVDANLIQGNHAGAGHGGGVRTQFVNGRDIPNSNNPNNGRPRPGMWYAVTLNNNMIVNNVAGWSGGGVSMQDTARSFIVNNTIAHNDSTATVSATFTTGDPNVSANQPAGISSEPHSPALNTAIPVQNTTSAYRDFSNPILSNNIVWENRSFHYDAMLLGGAGLVPVLSQSTVGECPSTASYQDLGVLGGGFTLDPVFSVLTDTSGYDPSNTSGDPGLVNAYCNGGRTLGTTPGPMLALPALDEGGAAWIDVRYGPLTQAWPDGSAPWNYHIAAPSSAIDAGSATNAPNMDYDNDVRPLGIGFDIGADEDAPGACDIGSNAGATCAVDDDCPPNSGPPVNQGACVIP